MINRAGFVKLIIILQMSNISTNCLAVQIHDILLPTVVSKANANAWSTPIAYRDGVIFTTSVEMPDSELTGTNLITVVRKGVLLNGRWLWDSYVVNAQTIDDQWHNAPSLGLDKRGYIHISYNMHNMPWQYAVSRKPLDISSFEFKGEVISTKEINEVKFYNRAPFPQIGHAAIPGNQVTYPAFFNDNNGELYITYRFAVSPKKNYLDRGYGAGIAKYSADTLSWSALGGEFAITPADADLEGASTQKVYPFALSYGWWAYLPRLAFDSENNMHVAWMWRKGKAGGDLELPSYARSTDEGKTYFSASGIDYHMPISVQSADKLAVYGPNTKYRGPTRILIGPSDDVYFLLQPINKSRSIVRFDTKNIKWYPPENLPNSAIEVAFDTKGNLWAFANGLKIFKRTANKGKWNLVYENRGIKYQIQKSLWCQPKVLAVPEKNMFLIHAQSCDAQRFKITQVIYD